VPPGVVSLSDPVGKSKRLRGRKHALKFRNNDRKQASAPEGVRLYAIGDIHGRLDLLESLLSLIERDQKGRAGLPVVLIFLGDYVDRGPDSKGVVDRLIRGFASPFMPVFLKGNHEDLLLSFLNDPVAGLNWLYNGGDAALLSYGVRLETIRLAAWGGPEGLVEAVREFRVVLPEAHLHFYEGLRLFCRIGDYFFTHAGVRPNVPLDQQSEHDLLWIRKEFLNSKEDFGAVVVHGHTPNRDPQDFRNRIGLDTFAVGTGKLTAAGFEGSRRWFLST
jgi:serine/threonine protein phosphatase 1